MFDEAVAAADRVVDFMIQGLMDVDAL